MKNIIFIFLLAISSVGAATLEKTESKFIRSCYNYGANDEVNSSFISCINSNFDDIEYKLRLKNIHVFFRHCNNIGDNELSFSFTSCVNDNFNEAEYALENVPYLRSCYNYGDGVSFSYESCVNSNFGTLDRYLR